ncbi:MAG: gamma-glutamyltransferase [Deltaproteobacteria bacterium]|nr:gamma-glutamyltransferase [Deltaproteobacteria bacterium]
MRFPGKAKLFVVFFFLLGICSAPDIGWTQRTAAGLVVSDSELATSAGMEMLNRGGNAVDAAVATAFALAVVDQASSGLGGGGFMVIYDAKTRRAHALDFRETAPRAARTELYAADGNPARQLSVTGALAVAVPGEVAGLLQASKRFGTLPPQVLVAPAIRYATDGFPLDATLQHAIDRQQGAMKKFTELGRVYMPKGEVPAEGEIIRQPELGDTLKAIASQGAESFYQGWIAEAIAETIQKNGGVLTTDDLKNYKAVWREPLIGSYRKRTVITMPPPSSGGVAILQILNVLEGYKLNQIPRNSATYLHLVTEVLKHAFADRARYLGDPDFVNAPVSKLISEDYASWIRGRISAVKTQPPGFYGLVHYKPEQGGTTHLSVIDRDGNAVACTLSVNTRFGSKLLAPKTGIVLNNEMDDFSIHSSGNTYGLLGNEANSLQPKKRPLSSMSPTIILRGDRPELIVGGAGGPRIISATLQVILNVIDFRMAVKEAVASPRIHHQWMPERLDVENDLPRESRSSLERRGHSLRERRGIGVVQAIVSTRGRVSGAADPRKAERALAD